MFASAPAPLEYIVLVIFAIRMFDVTLWIGKLFYRILIDPSLDMAIAMLIYGTAVVAAHYNNRSSFVFFSEYGYGIQAGMLFAVRVGVNNETCAITMATYTVRCN